MCMERRELRHDRHTATLSADYTVFSPKYRGKILVGDVALALDGIIRKTFARILTLNSSIWL